MFKNKVVVALLASVLLVPFSLHAENYNAQLNALSTWQTGEYNWSYALGKIKAAYAYDRGWTGLGQTVAVFDTGINTANREFNGKIAATYDVFARREQAITDTVGHGTFVSGIIGAARDNYGMQGVAFNSKILAIKIADSSGRLSFNNDQMAAAIRYALGKGARVFNNSWNSSAMITDYSKASLTYGFGSMLTAYQQAVAANAIIVFAAGNEGKANPGLYAALPYYYTELKAGWIAAVATDASGVIASYSNRCGYAAGWCMAAPGSNLISTLGTGYGMGSGTSFAAPVISAAAAILKQRWPALTNAQIRDILFKTANKSGIYANSAIYGQGFLDLDKASNPVGVVAVPTSGKVSSSTPVTQSAVSFGKSVKGIDVGGLQTIVVDEYGRDFGVEAQSLFSNAMPTFDSASAMQSFDKGLRVFEDKQAGTTLAFGENLDPRNTLPGAQLGGQRLFMEGGDEQVQLASAFNITPAALFGASDRATLFANSAVDNDALGNAYFGFLKNPVAMAARTSLGNGLYAKGGSFFGNVDNDPAAELTTSDDPNLANRNTGVWGSVVEMGMDVGKHSTLALTGGMVMEKGTLLGTASSGATALADSARTGFVSFSAKFDLGSGVNAFGGYDMGWTDARAAGNSLVNDVSTLSSSAFRMGFSKTGVMGAADKLGVVISQPLTVNTGSVGLNLPQSRNLDGSVNYISARGQMSATSRPIDIQAFYETPVDTSSSVAAGVLFRENNASGEGKNEAVLLGRYKLAF